MMINVGRFDEIVDMKPLEDLDCDVRLCQRLN